MRIADLRSEILRDIRDKKSQTWIGQRLNVSKTQVHRWESGANRIKWKTFVRICEIQKRNLNSALATLGAEKSSKIKSSAELIRYLASNQMKIGEIANKIGRSRYTVSRWFNGKAEPDLDDVLNAFINLKPAVLRIFLEPLVSDEFKKRNKKLFHFPKIEANLTYDYPVTALILRCFEMKDYLESDKHIDGYVARKTGITLAEEKQLIALLTNAGLVSYDGSKYSVSNKSVDIRGDAKRLLGFRRYWVQRALMHLDSMDKPSQVNIFGTNIFSVSSEGYAKIRELYMEFFESVRNTIDNDLNVPNSSVVLNVQIFDPSQK